VNKNSKVLVFIIFLAVLAAVIDLPKNLPIKFNLFGYKVDTQVSSPEINISLGNFNFKRDLNIKEGLDLQGGTELVLQAKMDGIKPADRSEALNSAKEVIARRVDLYGVSEPVIQTSQQSGNYRILVELPGIQNIQQAIELIGQTAQLDFRELPPGEASPSAVPIFSYVKTDLSGKDLKKAMVQFSPQTGEPVVALQFNSEGAKKFGDITSKNVGKPLAIFLDDLPVTAPRVNEPITSGNAVISGKFTVTEAKNLAIQLNAGALPVPVSIVEQKNIGATLGKESVTKSIRAGLIGLLIVISFMVAYYGKLGLLADIALIIYGLITLAIYKLIPVTLSLPGIAGFILSIGMAVDSNILIFERMKEELREGKPLVQAMELGFGRAWDSIKDANICTIITTLVLINPFNFSWLVTWGVIRGFALTLLIGVLISLFTGVVVSRTLVRVFYKLGKERS
jgi:preprotein translocase subunit SecD